PLPLVHSTVLAESFSYITSHDSSGNPGRCLLARPFVPVQRNQNPSIHGRWAMGPYACLPDFPHSILRTRRKNPRCVGGRERTSYPTQSKSTPANSHLPRSLLLRFISWFFSWLI